MKKSAWLIFVLLILLPASFALANGEFTYITVQGPGITGEITITNPALTADFSAFADFTQGAIDSPADPGEGYQIVRIHTADNKDVPFDQLHYYPYTGFVYYDGVVGGSSEYDGKWYAANPSAEEPFRAALKQRAQLAWYSFAVLIVILGVFFFMYRRK